MSATMDEISLFMAVTGADAEKAAQFLSFADWNVEQVH